MANEIETFRSMLTQTVSLEEALAPYLGITLEQAAREADAATTSEGLKRDRLKDLVLLLALRDAPSDLAPLAAALIWKSAPIATSIAEIREAIYRICDWRMGLNEEDLSRIISAHQRFEASFKNHLDRTGQTQGPEIDSFLQILHHEASGDHVVLELGECLLIVEMTDSHYLVGVQEDTGPLIVIEMIPYIRGGRWSRDPQPDPNAPPPVEPAMRQ